MDRLAGIVQGQWRIYWRRIYWRRISRVRDLTVGHRGITLLITVIILFKYLRLLRTASVEIARGNTTLVQWLLVGLSLAWLFVPLSSRDGISFRALRHLPLSVRDLLAIRMVTLLITPYSWMLVAASVGICFPLAHASRPGAAITAALLVIALSCSTGLAIDQLFNIAVWRRLLYAGLVLGAAIAYAASGQNGARFPQIVRISPTEFVARAAVGKNPILEIGALVMLNVLALATAWWSVREALVNVPQAGPGRRMDSVLFRLPGAVGGLAAKDFRYFRRLLDPYFGLLATLLCCLYLVGSDAPSVTVVWVSLVIVFIPVASLAFNSFGLDKRPGWERYALLPLSGATIMAGKNLALLLIIGMQVCPIILLASWRFGPTAGALVLVEAASLAAVYLAWGNWMSITFPAKMQFYRFAPAGSALPEVIAGLVIGSLPGVLVVYVLRTNAALAIWVAPLILLLCGIVYLLATMRSGMRFEQRRERIARSIS